MSVLQHKTGGFKVNVIERNDEKGIIKGAYLCPQSRTVKTKEFKQDELEETAKVVHSQVETETPKVPSKNKKTIVNKEEYQQQNNDKVVARDKSTGIELKDNTSQGIMKGKTVKINDNE
jgi:hypothetical protein